MDKATSAIVTILTAIIGVAIIAALVSKQADTSNVIKSLSGGFANDLKAALSPIAGGSVIGYGGSGASGSW